MEEECDAACVTNSEVDVCSSGKSIIFHLNLFLFSVNDDMM